MLAVLLDCVPVEETPGLAAVAILPEDEVEVTWPVNVIDHGSLGLTRIWDSGWVPWAVCGHELGNSLANLYLLACHRMLPGGPKCLGPGRESGFDVPDVPIEMKNAPTDIEERERRARLIGQWRLLVLVVVLAGLLLRGL